MDRRKALRDLGILTGGMVLLPSCEFIKEKAFIALNKLKINATQEKLMKSIVASIIPEGNIAGASFLALHDFVWIMADDLLDQNLQQSFINGLDYFEKEINVLKGRPFDKLSQKEKVESLASIKSDNTNSDKTRAQDLLFFVESTKSFTILGYMKSEYIMTDIMPYEQVPGTYGTCEPTDTTKRINING